MVSPACRTLTAAIVSSTGVSLSLKPRSTQRSMLSTPSRFSWPAICSLMAANEDKIAVRAATMQPWVRTGRLCYREVTQPAHLTVHEYVGHRHLVGSDGPAAASTTHRAVSRSVWCTNLPSTSMGPHLVMIVGLCAMPAIVSPGDDRSTPVRQHVGHRWCTGDARYGMLQAPKFLVRPGPSVAFGSPVNPTNGANAKPLSRGTA